MTDSVWCRAVGCLRAAWVRGLLSIATFTVSAYSTSPSRTTFGRLLFPDGPPMVPLRQLALIATGDLRHGFSSSERSR